MTGNLPFPEPKAARAAAPKGRLFLLDGTQLAYRGHYALIQKPLVTSKGQNVSALYVFATTLLRILEQERPEMLAVAFDPRGSTFRHERYSEYKATRDKTPDELVAMLPSIRRLVEGFNTPILEVERYEADDVIATIAVQAAGAGHEVFIVTGDKDFLQLVGPRVRLYNILRTEGEVDLQGPDTARTKFGVGPDRVVDVLALMGDSSDNVPGVPGVGAKTASELVARFGSVEEIYAHLDQVEKPAVRRRLEEARDAAFLSKELVTLDLDAPVRFEPEAFRYTGPDPDKLLPLLREYEMDSLVRRLSIARRAPATQTYSSVAAAADMDTLCRQLAAAPGFAFTVLADGTRPTHARLVGMAFSTAPGQATYVPLLDDACSKRERLAALRPLLEDAGRAKHVHDAKTQSLLLRPHGIVLRGVTFDSMLASYCVSPSELQHGLEHVAGKHLAVRKTHAEDVLGTGRNKVSFAAADPLRVRDFACEAADLVERLHPELTRQMQDSGVEALYREVELPLYQVLEDMERTGVRVDFAFLRQLSVEYQTRIDRLTARIYDLAGCEFNINSPRQLGPVLFEKVEVHKAYTRKKPRRTATGYSTDASVLEAFRDHPLVAAILEYRGLVKLKGTYIDALPELADPDTGRIHTSFNQAVAATGRLSSSDPNLQNIPIRTEEGRQIRRAFIAGHEGWVMLSADYSQVELRIMAHLSGDENLRRAFREGQDVHRWTAGLIFGMPPDQVPGELRSRAKAINFGVIYGMGAQRLAQETGMTVPEATRFIEAYFRTFSGVKAFLDQTLRDAHQNGFVTTMLGRRRYVPDLDSEHSRIAAAARNIAVNTPIQGTAADLIKVAMIRIHQRIQERGLNAHMLLQVHDELLFECAQDEADALAELVRDTMAHAIELEVPLVVEVGVGRSWFEAH